jgi:hypothetical protein
MYVIENNNLKHIVDIDSVKKTGDGFIDGAGFAARQLEFDLLSPSITDIAYTTKRDTGLLWIATTEGLFLAAEKNFRPDSLPELKLFRRDIEVAEGLRNRSVYAFPSILNDSWWQQKAVFAYNLEKDDYITIDIFDWNMDHVIRLVDHEFRYAGSARPTGEGYSTLRAKDFWDGTYRNDNGKRVAPGVYYFRFTSDKNGRAFGKIVVAKSAEW